MISILYGFTIGQHVPPCAVFDTVEWGEVTARLYRSDAFRVATPATADWLVTVRERLDIPMAVGVHRTIPQADGEAIQHFIGGLVTRGAGMQPAGESGYALPTHLTRCEGLWGPALGRLRGPLGPGCIPAFHLHDLELVRPDEAPEDQWIREGR